MAATQQEKAKLEGTFKQVLKGCKAEHVWPYFADFCGLYKWAPNLASSDLVEGTRNEAGAVRLCVAKVVEGQQAAWGREKLVEIDHEKRLLRYELLENTVVVKGYESTLRVYDVEEGEGGGCVVDWVCKADTIEGTEWELYREMLLTSFDYALKKLVEDISNNGNGCAT